MEQTMDNMEILKPIPIPYPGFLKHAKEVTKNVSEARPILKGVHHRPDGSLVVTDSHRLYIAKNMHTIDEEVVLDPKSGEEIPGNYPDVSRLIPMNDAKYILPIEDIKLTIDAVKMLQLSGQLMYSGTKKTSKNLITIQLTCDDENKIMLQSNTAISKSEFFLTFAPDIETGFAMKFNTEYFIHALTLFKDAGFTRVDMHIHGRNYPFILKGANDDLIALLLPVRTEK